MWNRVIKYMASRENILNDWSLISHVSRLGLQFFHCRIFGLEHPWQWKKAKGTQRQMTKTKANWGLCIWDGGKGGGLPNGTATKVLLGKEEGVSRNRDRNFCHELCESKSCFLPFGVSQKHTWISILLDAPASTSLSRDFASHNVLLRHFREEYNDFLQESVSCCISKTETCWKGELEKNVLLRI